jgi:hypothetical protein
MESTDFINVIIELYCYMYVMEYIFFVHKVTRLSSYVGLGKCWLILGRSVTNRGQFAETLATVY